MAPHGVEYVSKTQLYLRVKKPILERQRRARMNSCLDTLKTLVSELQGDDAILRMDKAEMLECALDFIKSELASSVKPPPAILKEGSEPEKLPSDTEPSKEVLYADSFRNGFMNAVNEVSRAMALTPGFGVGLGKAVMTQLGGEFNRVVKSTERIHQKQKQQQRQQSSDEQPAKATRLAQDESSSDEGKDSDGSLFTADLMYTVGRGGRRQSSHWRPW